MEGKIIKALNETLTESEKAGIKDLVYDLNALNDWYMDDDDDEFTAKLLKGAKEEAEEN